MINDLSSRYNNTQTCIKISFRLTMLGCRSSFRRAISLIAVEGTLGNFMILMLMEKTNPKRKLTPSSSDSSLIFFIATISPVFLF